MSVFKTKLGLRQAQTDKFESLFKQRIPPNVLLSSVEAHSET